VRDDGALPGRALWLLELLLRKTNWTDGTMVKKFTYSIIGILLFLLSGSLFSGALQFHNVISDRMQRFDSFPESAWLIVLGSLLISGATVLRRRRAAVRPR